MDYHSTDYLIMNLKKTAKATGIANLIIPLIVLGVTFGELGLINISGLSFNLKTISFFGISLSALNTVLYAVYFILWFKFLALLSKENKDNRNIRTAVLFGYFGNGVLLASIFMGICSTLFVVAFKQTDINITGLAYGVFPKEILNVNSAFNMVYDILIAVMYIFLFIETDKDSPMHVILLLLPITILVDCLSTVFPITILSSGLSLASIIIELIFFIQISNGHVFRKNETGIKETVTLSE